MRVLFWQSGRARIARNCTLYVNCVLVMKDFLRCRIAIRPHAENQAPSQEGLYWWPEGRRRMRAAAAEASRAESTRAESMMS